MRFEPSCKYKRIDQAVFAEGVVTAWISSDDEDTCWDAYLREIPLGQYQQSTIWARTKKVEAWDSLRVVFTIENVIVGGFQLLKRSSWWGKIGYVSKGPVLWPDCPALSLYVIAILCKVVRREGLWALVIQPPNQCVQMSARLSAAGFLPNVLIDIIEATWIVDLRGGFEEVEKRMRKTARNQVRQAVKKGLTYREGEKEELGTFFDLMLATCRRQGVEPQPSDVRSFLALWDASREAGCARLSFVEYKGKPIAGNISIMFGQVVTIYKKGWNSVEGNPNPNDFLWYEELKWASSSGYQFCDFVGFDTRMAITMLRGEPKSDEQKRSRYEFFTHFGGSPRLLPEARVYFPNPAVRLAYRVIFYNKIRRVKENRRLVDQTIDLSLNV